MKNQTKYNNLEKAYKTAYAKYAPIRAAYRNGEVSDNDFLIARREFEAVKFALDQAEANLK
jgi:hypothetical protein